MSNGSVEHGPGAGQAAPSEQVENYLRGFAQAEARDTHSVDPQVTKLLQRLRARRPRLLAELSTKVQ